MTVTLESLARHLTASGLTIAVAESATGGLIAAELSRLPGSSAYFKGAIVAYDAFSKTALLGIPESLLKEHGSVSAEACKAMAEAARRLFQADLGLAETSIAGPGGGTETKPVGLSYVALSGVGGTQVMERKLGGTREENRRNIAAMAMGLLAHGVTAP